MSNKTARIRGERVPVEEFLADVEDQLKDNTIGCGDPAYFDIMRAMNKSRTTWVMNHLRKALAGQKGVNMPPAVDKDGFVWRLDDFETIESDEY